MKLPSRIRRIMVVAGYAAFAVLALLVSFYLTFPAEAVGQRLSYEVRARSGGAYALSFSEVSPYRLTGFAAEKVHLRASRSGQQPLDIEVDGVRVRLRLLPLFLLRLSASAAVDLGEGTVGGSFTPRGEGALDAELVIEDFNLASPPLIPKLVGLPLAGRIDGTAETAWRPDVRSTTGHARFTLAKASFGPGTISGFTLPLTDLGTLKPEIVIENGRLRVTSLKQEGGQVQLRVSGTVQLNREVEQSQLDLCIQLKPDPAYLTKNPNVETALQLAAARFRKDGQGFLNIPIGGSLRSPQTRAGICQGSPR